MRNARINLQNTPERAGVSRRPVRFESGGATLRGVLYAPDDREPSHPAVIVTGAWTMIKEQAPGTYARELATRGFAALAFDFTGWGQSGGTPRYVEDPATKTADIAAAADFLAAQEEIDSSRIFGIGVCASSGYMAAAAADNDELRKLALIAPWLHDALMAEAIYGGPDMAAKLIAASEAEGASETVIVAASVEDDSAIMFQAPYYTEPDRGMIPEYDNKFSALSWKPWLTYDALASADRLTKPLLIVGSPAIALPAGVAAYEARTNAPLEKLWLGADVSQFDFYDRKDAVTASADAVASFFVG